MYARKIAQISETRRYARRNAGSLSYRRQRKASVDSQAIRERGTSRHRQLFLVFLFTVCQFIFLQSSIFSLKDITIEGDRAISKEVIRGAMDLGDSPSYWSLAPQDIQSSLADLQGVESARVKLGFPSSLSVTIIERKPVYRICWVAAAHTAYGVDREGVIVADEPPQAGPISIALQRPVRVGGRLSPSELKVLEFFSKNAANPLLTDIKLIEFSNDGEVTLRFAYKTLTIPIRLGRPEQLGYKLFVLQELMSSLKAERAVVLSIDLRFTTPIVRTPVTVQPAL